MSELHISNTSLQQCDATHLAVYREGLEDTTLRVGGSTSLGPDNATGCLPDALLFCEATQVAASPLYCPSLAFRRQLQMAPNQLELVGPLAPGIALDCNVCILSHLLLNAVLVSNPHAVVPIFYF